MSLQMVDFIVLIINSDIIVIMFFQKQNLSVFHSNQPDENTNLLSILDKSEIAINQSFIQRIKLQREKIQELTDRYSDQNLEVQKKKEEINHLKNRIEELQANQSYKQAYEELKRQYEELYQKYEIVFFQQEEAEKRDKHQIDVLQQQLEQKKQTEKTLKQQLNLLPVYYNALLEDQGEVIKNLQRTMARNEENLRNQIKQLTKQLTVMKQKVQQKQIKRQSSQKTLRKYSKVKEEELQRLKKTLTKTQNQCSKYRTSTTYKEGQWESQKQSLYIDLQNANMCLASLRKQVTHKILEIQSLKESVHKLETKNKILQENIDALKHEVKKAKNKHNEAIRVISQEKSLKCRYGDSLQRLKRQNIKHVQDYNLIQAEFNRYKILAEKRQEHHRLHKVLSHCHP